MTFVLKLVVKGSCHLQVFEAKTFQRENVFQVKWDSKT